MLRQVPSTRKMVGRDSDIGKSSINGRIWTTASSKIAQANTNSNTNTHTKANYNYNYKYKNRRNIIIRTAHLCQALVYDPLSPFSPLLPHQHLAGQEDFAGWPGICFHDLWFVFWIFCFGRHLVRFCLSFISICWGDHLESVWWGLMMKWYTTMTTIVVI